MAPIAKKCSDMTRFITICVAFFATSCADREKEQVTAYLKPGEIVRIVSVEPRPPHPSKPALCVEILPAASGPTEPSFVSFADFASDHAIFDGWTAIELRASPQVSFQTIADAVKAASEPDGTDVWQLAPPCPD